MADIECEDKSCEACVTRVKGEAGVKDWLEGNEGLRLKIVFQYRDYKHKTKTSKMNGLSDEMQESKHWEDGWLNMITLMVGPLNDMVRAKDTDRRMAIKEYDWCKTHEVSFTYLGACSRGSTFIIDCKPRCTIWKPTADDPLWLTQPDGSMIRNPKSIKIPY